MPRNLFAKRLREARKSKGWTQEELGDKTGFKPSAISHFEVGGRRPLLESVLPLADALGVSVDWLIGRSEIEKPLSPQEQRHHQQVRHLGPTQREDVANFVAAISEDGTDW